VKQLCGFLRLTGNYHGFIEGYAAIASPLTDLLKDAFHWTMVEQQAFDDLKKAMTEAPLLALPNYEIPFQLETDASGWGLSVVLLQQGHSICFHNKNL